MSEDLVESVDQLDAGKVEGTVERSEVELKAIEFGWNPNGVEGKEFVSAEEFIARKPIYDEISKLKRTIKSQSKAFESFQSHHNQTIRRMEEQKAKELRKAREAALDIGDIDKVRELDKEIDSQVITKAPVTTTSDNDIAFEEFVERNSWYENDLEMRGAAIELGRTIANSGKTLPPEEFYGLIEKKIKERYFTPKQKQSAPANSPVEGDTSRGRSGGKHKYTERDLNDLDRQIMNNIVRGSNGKMTKEQYIADLEKSGYFNS